MTSMHTASTPPCRPGHCVGNSNSSLSIFKTVKPESPNPPDYVLQVRKYALHCVKPCSADCSRHSTRSTPTTCSKITTKPTVRKASTSAKFGTVLERRAFACNVNKPHTMQSLHTDATPKHEMHEDQALTCIKPSIVLIASA